MLAYSFYFSIGLTLIFSLLTSLYYYRHFFRRDLSIAIVLYSLFIFSIVYFVSFEGNIGLGIGLLGILSIIRFRSIPENLVDIGFIFYAIALGLLNASIKEIAHLLTIDVLMTSVLILLTSRLVFKKELKNTQIIFDEIHLEYLNNPSDLIKVIKNKYGIQPVNIQISKIDYLKDSMHIEVSYHS